MCRKFIINAKYVSEITIPISLDFIDYVDENGRTYSNDSYSSNLKSYGDITLNFEGTRAMLMEPTRYAIRQVLKRLHSTNSGSVTVHCSDGDQSF